MTDATHTRRMSRQHAAERLVDIAYALTGGLELELRDAGDRVTVPVADEVVLTHTSTADVERVVVDIRLSWSAPTPIRPHRRQP